MIRPGEPTPLPPMSCDAALLVLSPAWSPLAPLFYLYSLLPVRSALGPWVLLPPVLVVSWSQGRRSSTGRTQPDASSGSGTGRWGQRSAAVAGLGGWLAPCQKPRC
jgi:hypothetical protein